MFTDTHCHLLSEYYDDINSELSLANKCHVNRFIVSGYNYESSLEVLDLIKNYSCIYGTIGLHPENCNERFDYKIFDNLPSKILAIGEIGLDYHYDKDNKELQLSHFERQLVIAENLGLPVVIHSRDATEDTINTLKNHHLKGVIHSFSGSYETAQIYLKMGFKLGINGVITFKNSNLKSVISRLSPSDIILETDSPYLTPVPFRGEKNSSCHIFDIASYVADLFDISLESLAEITNLNISQIFDI